MTIRELIDQLEEIARRVGDHARVAVPKGHYGDLEEIDEVAYRGGSTVELRT